MLGSNLWPVDEWNTRVGDGLVSVAREDLEAAIGLFELMAKFNIAPALQGGYASFASSLRSRLPVESKGGE